MARVPNPGEAPSNRMPAIVLVADIAGAILLDVIKILCLFLVFTLPVGVAAAVGSQYGSIAGWIAGGLAGAAEFIPYVGGSVESLGVVMAWLIGVLGWIVFTPLLWFQGAKVFTHSWKSFGAYILGLVLSFIPVIDMILPTFTFSVGVICLDARREYKKKYREWEEKHEAWERQEQMERMEYARNAAEAVRARREARQQEEIPESAMQPA